MSGGGGGGGGRCEEGVFWKCKKSDKTRISVERNAKRISGLRLPGKLKRREVRGVCVAKALVCSWVLCMLKRQ